MKILADEEFRYLRESCTSTHFDLIRRNGAYPYDYMYIFTRFDERQHPPQDAFFSKLSSRPCSDAEYAHAIRVWNAFGCETMAHCHNIYLQLDVLLLPDLFEKFRSSCLTHCILYLAHYYTAPGPVWDAALRPGIDVDMYHFIKNFMRGGISVISTRYAQAINVLTLPATYDACLPKMNLIYLGANNWYGWAMSQPLPTHGVQFPQLDQIKALKVEQLPDDAVNS